MKLILLVEKDNKLQEVLLDENQEVMLEHYVERLTDNNFVFAQNDIRIQDKQLIIDLENRNSDLNVSIRNGEVKSVKEINKYV